MSHWHDREKLLEEITARAETDLVFRKRLLTNPEPAILDAFRVTLPPGFRIRFIEKPAAVDLLVVLPEAHVPGYLDDDDLDAVAGGTAGSTDTW
jgi:hypothetical protein